MLYDRETESVWYPLHDGAFDAVGGKLKGTQMPFVVKPDRVSLGEWGRTHPNTLVLLPADEDGG